MATKFGYVERNLENDVNWANVGKGFSDMLLAERDERKAKKENLDDLMGDTLEGFRKNAPIGYNTTFNDHMIGLGANSSSFVLAANKDLKAGNITPEEYMRKLHRLNSSADTTFALANNYNKLYEDKLKRMDAKDSGNVEQAAFEAMSKLVDFNKHDFMIDGDGTIVAAPLITDENGITKLDANNARSVQAIFNLAQNNVDRFDVEGVVAESVQKLGKIVLGTSVAATYTKQGMDVLIEGIKKADPAEYKEWKDQQITKMMVDKLDVASVLTDYSSDYEATTDKKEWLANKDKFIYVDIENGKEILIGELTEDQIADAKNILDGVIESQVGSSEIEKATAEREYPRASESSIRRGGARNDKMKLAGIWNKMYYATSIEEKNQLAQTIINDKYSKDLGLASFKFTPDGKNIDVKFIDSRQDEYLTVPDNPSIGAWSILGSFLTGESNEKEAIRLGGGVQDGEYMAASGVRAELRGDPVGAGAREIRANSDVSLFESRDSEDVVEDFARMYERYGFTFKDAFVGNTITVTGPDETTYKFNTMNSGNKGKLAMDDLNNWMASKLTAENAERAYQTSRSGDVGVAEPESPGATEGMTPEELIEYYKK
mgnify:CR=1 FL=1